MAVAAGGGRGPVHRRQRPPTGVQGRIWPPGSSAPWRATATGFNRDDISAAQAELYDPSGSPSTPRGTCTSPTRATGGCGKSMRRAAGSPPLPAAERRTTSATARTAGTATPATAAGPPGRNCSSCLRLQWMAPATCTSLTATTWCAWWAGERTSSPRWPGTGRSPEAVPNSGRRAPRGPCCSTSCAVAGQQGKRHNPGFWATAQLVLRRALSRRVPDIHVVTDPGQIAPLLQGTAAISLKAGPALFALVIDVRSPTVGRLVGISLAGSSYL